MGLLVSIAPRVLNAALFSLLAVKSAIAMQWTTLFFTIAMSMGYIYGQGNAVLWILRFDPHVFYEQHQAKWLCRENAPTDVGRSLTHNDTSGHLRISVTANDGNTVKTADI